MHGSAAVGWLLTAVCTFTGGACLLRARAVGGRWRRAARSEALMGLGMAVMALSGSVPMALGLPPVASMLVFVMLFGAVGVRELTLLRESRRRGQAAVHHVHHLVGAVAMVYMAVAAHAPTGSYGSRVASASGHGHMGASAGLPLLTGVLLAYFAAYVLRTGMRLMPGPAPSRAVGTGGPLMTGEAGQDGICRTGRDMPGLAAACRLAMGTGMLAMLMML